MQEGVRIALGTQPFMGFLPSACSFDSPIPRAAFREAVISA